jgi:hypothetical protein
MTYNENAGREARRPRNCDCPSLPDYTYHFGFAPFNVRRNQVVELVPNGVYLVHSRRGDVGVPVTLHQLPSSRFLFYRTVVSCPAGLVGWASTPTWKSVSLARQADGRVIELPSHLDYDLLERVRPDSSRLNVIRAGASRPPLAEALAQWREKVQ